MSSTVETLMPRVARRTARYTSSPWAGLEPVLHRHPDMIFFGGGTPARELIPTERLRWAAERAWDDAPEALGYGELAGYRPLRELIASRLADRGMTVDIDHLVVTNGSQQGIDLVARLMLDPGDPVIVEAPTFVDALQTFAAYEATYVPVLMDDEGIRLDALAMAMADQERPPKLIYTIPTFQNPTGVTLTRERRAGLLALARDHHLLIVEDDPYGELRYDGEPVPPLRALDPDVVHLGTFSKTIAPGLRVGWVVAPDSLIDLLHSAKEGTDLHTNRMTTRTIYHTAAGWLDDHVATARDLYRNRRDAMLATLDERMPTGVTWSEPEGGFFVWVEFPEGLDTRELLPIAADHGVVYLPGSWFYPGPGGERALRLNFSTLPEDRIIEGVRRLAAVITDRAAG